jgi:replication-associated recombination protein RarA
MNAPTTINDIVFKSASEKAKITDITVNSKPFPASGVNGIIIYGIYGTGKTALAKLLPDAIERSKGGTSANARFVSCMSGSNNVNAIQNLATQASFVPQSSHHYFILDEVDMLTDNAMKQLKAAMNTPDTIFIMTTNHINMVDKGVLNRSILVDFNAAPASQWLPIAHKVLAAKNVTGISDAALLAIINTCNGSARQIINAVESLAARTRRNSMRIVKPVPPSPPTP